MPMLVVTLNSSLPSRNGSPTAPCWICGGQAFRPFLVVVRVLAGDQEFVRRRSARSGPRRADRSGDALRGIEASRVVAGVACPSTSLTILKRSRSMYSTATSRRWPGALHAQGDVLDQDRVAVHQPGQRIGAAPACAAASSACLRSVMSWTRPDSGASLPGSCGVGLRRSSAPRTACWSACAGPAAPVRSRCRRRLDSRRSIAVRRAFRAIVFEQARRATSVHGRDCGDALAAEDAVRLAGEVQGAAGRGPIASRRSAPAPARDRTAPCRACSVGDVTAQGQRPCTRVRPTPSASNCGTVGDRQPQTGAGYCGDVVQPDHLAADRQAGRSSAR